MGLEFLIRVRRSSLWMGALVALMLASYVSPRDGLAAALGTAWSLVNLALLQRLVIALTGPERSEIAGLKAAGFSLLSMLGLFGAGALLLSWLPPQSLLWGFLVPFGVIVLKAASLMLLGSRFWKRTFSSGTVRAVLVLISMLSFAAPALASSQDPDSGAHAIAPATHGEAPSSEAHGESEGPQKFPNVITVLVRAFPNAGWAHVLHQYEAVIFSLFVGFLICVVAFLASRNAQMIPGPLQNAVEMLIEKLYDFVVGILGPVHGPRYVPFLGTLFTYILAMNLFGLIPFMDSPTSNLNVTVGLAITVFLYAQAIGLRRLGPIGYLDHMAGNPRTPIQWMLVPLMLPIHLLGELAKPISLSCRLFGNVFGEDMLLVAFASLGVTTLAFTGLPIGLPLQLPFLLLALLTGTLQALVFTVLSTIYFLLMLPHDEDHADHPAEVHSAP